MKHLIEHRIVDETKLEEALSQPGWVLVDKWCYLMVDHHFYYKFLLKRIAADVSEK